MSTATVPTTVRFDKESKEKATSILDSLGLSFNSYLNLAVKQLINQRKVPFEIKLEEDIPNEDTRVAMLEAEAKAAGLIKDNSPAFDNVDELMGALNKFANTGLIEQEKQAWGKAVEDKCQRC